MNRTILSENLEIALCKNCVLFRNANAITDDWIVVGAHRTDKDYSNLTEDEATELYYEWINLFLGGR